MLWIPQMNAHTCPYENRDTHGAMHTNLRVCLCCSRIDGGGGVGTIAISLHINTESTPTPSYSILACGANAHATRDGVKSKT